MHAELLLPLLDPSRRAEMALDALIDVIGRAICHGGDADCRRFFEILAPAAQWRRRSRVSTLREQAVNPVAEMEVIRWRR